MTGGRSWTRRALLLAGSVAVLLLGAGPAASAHPLSTSAVLLDLHDHTVVGTVELPLDQLSVALGERLTAASVLEPMTTAALRRYVGDHLYATQADGRPWSTVTSGGRVEQVDGVDNLVLDATLTPGSGVVGDFVLHDDVIVDRLVSHRIFVSARYGDAGPYTELAMLSWQTQSVPVASASPPPAGRGFVDAVTLGVHHIASGSDHLLFLIMLLLPAPLVVSGRRWRRPTNPETGALVRTSVRVVHVVTAFAVGHSCTLALSALGLVHLPTRLVESGIALSVLVSAAHAIRPLVRRGEVLIAGGFGLLHGLSFAAVLSGLDLSRTGLVSTLLGFNLGIELAQLAVVALIVPSLVLLARTPAYPAFRVGTGALGVALAAVWLAERMGIISSNPTEPVSDVLVTHPVVLALALAGTALALAGASRARAGRAPSRHVAPTRTPSPATARRADAAAAQGPHRADEYLCSRPSAPPT